MKNNSRKRNSILNAITSIGGQLLTTILKFVTRTVFIYQLGVAYLGIEGLFINILQLLSLTELGFDTAINFKLYKPLAEGDDERIRILMKFYKNAYRIIGFVILCLGLLMVPLLPLLIKDYEKLELLNINAIVVFIIYLLQSVSTYWFFAYKSAIVKAAQKTYVLNIVDYAITILTNAFQIILLVVYHDFLLYIICVIGFNIIRNAVNAKVATKMFPHVFIHESKSISVLEIKEMIKDCLALLLYKINSVALQTTANLVLSSFIGLAIVGIFSNYLLIYHAIRAFVDKLFSSVKASLGNAYVSESLERNYMLFQTMNFLTILFYGTACVGIGVTANDFIECWVGNKYVIPQPLPILVGIMFLFAGLKMNLGQIRNISGAFRQMWFRPLLGIIINVVVSIIMVQKIGICGVLLGTIISDLLTNFLVDPMVIHKYSFKGIMPVFRYYQQNIQYFVILAAIGFSDYWICQLIFPGHSIFSVIAHILVCCLSIPTIFLVIYHKTDYCQYAFSIIVPYLKKIHNNK